jgi:putative polymerase
VSSATRTTAYHLATDGVFGDGRAAARTPTIPAAGIVVVAAVFNFVLCIISTHGFRIGSGEVVACEGLILLTALVLARDALSRDFLAWSIVLVGSLAFLRLSNDQLDLKVARDLAIPLVFCALGITVRDRRVGDGLVYVLVALVLAVGLFELFALSTYVHLVDIPTYYIDKGSLDPAQAKLVGGKLFVSGVRPNEQSHFLDFLGGHRVSSIFLEPVSAGNFPVIAFSWLAVRFKHSPKLNGFFILLCIVELLLADARFGVLTCALIGVVLLTPIATRPVPSFFIPIAVIGLLLLSVPVLNLRAWTDDLQGRLFESGFILSSFDLMQWMGLSGTEYPTLDCGYCYLFNNAGLVVASVLWVLFVGRIDADDEAARLRCAVALYIALSLSINCSIFTIKTAALLWFLYGLVYPRPTPREGRIARAMR